MSWCKLEVEVSSPKSIITSAAESQNQEVPPLVVAAINLKTRFNAQVKLLRLPCMLSLWLSCLKAVTLRDKVKLGIPESGSGVTIQQLLVQSYSNPHMWVHPATKAYAQPIAYSLEFFIVVLASLAGILCLTVHCVMCCSPAVTAYHSTHSTLCTQAQCADCWVTVKNSL